MRKILASLAASISLFLICPAAAQTICPTTAIANGNPADATLVTSWFSCKAPTNSPTFTGNVGMSASSGTSLQVKGAGTTSADYAAAIEDSSGNNLFAVRNDGFSYFAHGGTTSLTLDQTGNLTALGSVAVGGTFGTSNIRLQVTGASATSSDYAAVVTDNAGNNLFYVRDDGFASFGHAGTTSLVVDASGRVGIGTNGPAQALDVIGQVRVAVLASASGTNLCIDASNVIASCSSSIRYKEHVRIAAFGLPEVMAMRPVTFKWKDRDEQDFGLIAEEVAKINPLFVTRKSGKIEGVKYPQLTALLAKAVQEQQAEIQHLTAENEKRSEALARQAAEISQMHRELAALERKVAVRTASK